ncbi:MOP flippase family protein [Geobacter argillaceus]|uniref:PST family polysaccharide transporter/lipopolysaccharide exporter n=1 Tax=Geobacter argillaceus TaxID=345631 RepID=A0A562VPN9_9BACT|nr:MOP flippase family protein [Geobacter argillaceus]TWJ19870.1 PST family polysaccharide transporter/lipopolysaccharide exporter [Geobacter argillaceus]
MIESVTWKSLKHSAISAGKWSLAATLFGTCLDLIKVIILTRLLKPTDFGLMAIATLVVTHFSTYSGLGTGPAIIQRQNVSRQQLSSIFWLNIFIALIIFAVICAITPLVTAFFREPLLSSIIPVMACSFLIMSPGNLVSWLLEKELHFALLSKQDIVIKVIEILVTIIGAFCMQSVWALVWGFLARSTAGSILYVWAGYSRWPLMFHFKWEDIRGFMRFGFFQMGECSIMDIGSRLDQLLIGKLLGTAELGFYNFAINQLIGPLSTFNQILSRVSFPIFACMQYDITGLRHSFLKMINLLSAINASLLFGLAGIAPLLIPLVFGAQWTPSVLLVQLLVMYSFIKCINEQIRSLVLAKGQADISFRWNLGLMFASALFIVSGAKQGGILGVAVALIVLMASALLASYIYMLKPIIGSSGKEYFTAIVKPAVSALLMGGCVWFVSSVSNHSYSWLTVEICGGVLIYLTLLWFTDRSLVLGLVAGAGYGREK